MRARRPAGTAGLDASVGSGVDPGVMSVLLILDTELYRRLDAANLLRKERDLDDGQVAVAFVQLPLPAVRMALRAHVEARSVRQHEI